jgi:sugar lactone lactonase YvrE
MAADNGILYVAYRSFDLLRSSNQLQVLAYDLGSHKELRHVTITVPKVHGARASNGLALSRDGQTLAYVEAHEPYLVRKNGDPIRCPFLIEIISGCSRASTVIRYASPQIITSTESRR